MKYSSEEMASRRILALGLATLYSMKGYRHVTYSGFLYGSEVTVYVDTIEEAKKAELESRTHRLDGCSSQIQ